MKSQPRITIERDGQLLHHVTGQLLPKEQLVEVLNDYFVSAASEILALNISSLPTRAPPPTIDPHEVCGRILELQANKAMGPDNIPSRILSWDGVCLDGFQLGLVSHEVPNGPQFSFVIMINDLQTVSSRSTNCKYVDDVTISEMSEQLMYLLCLVELVPMI